MRAGMSRSSFGRGSKIRTCDPRFPKPVLYQAELCPVDRQHRLSALSEKGKSAAPPGVDAAAQTPETKGMFDITQPWPFGINRTNWYWFAGGFVAVVGLLLLLDATVSQSAQAWPAPWGWFFRFITDIGMAEWWLFPTAKIFLVCLGLVAISRDPVARNAWLEASGLAGFLFAGVALPSLATAIIKRVVGRSRPELFDSVGYLDFNVNLTDYAYQSFPSGHATTVFAMAMVVCFLGGRRWVLPALVVAVLVAFSRVPVGAHYPTDVFAGSVCGIVFTYVVRNLFALRGWVFQREPDGRILRKPFVAIPQFWADLNRSR